MDVKLVILLCVASVAFGSDFYNYGPVSYNPYYSVGGYPVETQEEYEYYDQSYGHAPAVASYSGVQQHQVPYINYNTRVGSPGLQPVAAPVVSNVQVTSAPIQAAQPAIVSTTPVPLNNVNVFPYQQEQHAVVPVVTSTVAPILSKSYQLGLVYPHTGLIPAVPSTVDNAAVSNLNSESVITPTPATPVVYSTTQSPIVASNVAGSSISSNFGAINSPAFAAPRSNVVSVPYPSPSPYLSNIVSTGGNNFALHQGSTLVKSNVPDSNTLVYFSNPGSSAQNLYVPSFANQIINNGNFYSPTLSKSSAPLRSAGIFNPGLYATTPYPLAQNVFSSGQSQLLSAGNFGGSIPTNVNSLNVIPSSPFNPFSRNSQPVITTVSPTDTSNVISYSTTTPGPINGFVPVTSTYTSIKKQTVYAAPQPNGQSLFYAGGVNPVAYNINTLSQNSAAIPTTYSANQGLSYTSVPVSTLSPLVSHNGSPIPVIYSTTPAPIITTIPGPTTSTQESLAQITSTPASIVVTTQKPSSTTFYTTNQSSKVTAVPPTTQSSFNYASNVGVQSTTTLLPSTVQNTASRVSFSTVKPTTQDSNYVPSSFATKPSTALVTNPTTVSSTVQSSTVKYPVTPSTSSTATSYITQSSVSTQKPTVTYNNINKQDAFTAALSGFSKPSTYKPSVTNNYLSSSTIYNKGIQSTYTTPASYTTPTYTTQSSFTTQKPTVLYGINKQNTFSTTLSGLSEPTTYKPFVTNNYIGSSSVYNKGFPSTYTTPASISTASYATQPSITTQKPSVSFSVNKQDAFSAALSGFSKPTTYRPSVTNNYVSSSSIYNKEAQSTYTTPGTYSTASYTTQSAFPAQKPIASYNINKQNTFSGFVKPTTYKPFVTNNYVSSVFNKGVQSTYTTPASYSTTTSFATQKPSVNYNNVNRQDAFTAALSGFSNPTTYKPFVTNNYVSSSAYNKGIQSTYSTPAPYSTTTSFATQKPTVTYNNVNRQDAFTAALSGFSNPTTYKPFVTNNYVSSAAYNKGVQSTYTTPASYSTTTSFATQKPTVTYNNVNRQDAFTAALSGFSNPTTYKPFVTNNYVSSSAYNKGVQSTYTTPASYSTTTNTVTQKPTVTYNNVNRQDAFTAALSGFSNPTTYKPFVTNNYVSSSAYNKGVQSTYTTPASYSTTTNSVTQKPTVTYNNVNRQDAFTAALSGFSNPTTYKPFVTNNYVSSSAYNKGIQSTYSTPAPYSTTTSFATQKPTVTYNNVNRQDAFTAALSGFSNPTTYKPFVTNNYVSSAAYNKGVQSTYTTPASYSTTTSFATQKPTVTYNNVNRQDAFTAALSGFSNPTTYKPFVTNNYVSSSAYNKGVQSTYTTPASYSTTTNTVTQKPTVTYNNVNRQDAFTAALSGFSNPTTYKPFVTNNYVSSSAYNKGVQSTYTTPASYSTTTNSVTQKPTVTYNNVNRQDAFTAALSGFSNPTTYKPFVTNNYVSSSAYNKGVQSTYTTPASYSTITNSVTQKPTVTYNNVNRQDAFTAALSGFSNPTTYKTPVNNYDVSSTIVNKGSQSTYTTPSTFSTTYNLPSSSVSTTTNSEYVTPTTAPPTASKFESQKTSSVISARPASIVSSGTQTGSFVTNTYKPSKISYSRPVFYTNLYPKNTGTYNFNSFVNKASNSVYQPNNQYVPFVTIPASTRYTSSTVQRKEIVPVVSNYQGGLNVIVQPPVVASETGTTIVPSTLDYSATFVSQSSPSEAVSNYVHSENYLPPVVPAVSDVGSNGVLTYVSDPVVTTTVAPPIVVSTTPRTLPLSYESSEALNVIPNTNQATVKPVVYTTTPVITKVDSSPTLIPISVPGSTEFVQVSSSLAAEPEVTTVNYVK